MGGAGFDPPFVNTPAVSVPPVALRYEGLLKDWVLDAPGNYRSVTSTEQGMITSICVNQGQIKSSPQTGNTLDQIVYLGSPTLQADVEDRIRKSNPAAALVASGKARISKIVVQTSGGRLIAEVFFQALDTPNSKVLSRKWSN